MSAINKILLTITGLLAALSLLLVTKDQIPGPALGGAESGLAANIATSSTWVVGQGENEVVIFQGQKGGLTNPCTSRVITTKAEPILINFAGTSSSTATTTLDSLWGHLQAASTTEVYDSAVFGCGWWGAKGAGAATATISTTEFR